MQAVFDIVAQMEVLADFERNLLKGLVVSRKMLNFAALTTFIHLNLNAYEKEN